MLVVMVIAIIFEETMLKLANKFYCSFLPIDSAGSEAEKIIIKRAKWINGGMYLVLANITLMCILISPIFGSNREWLILDLLVEEYLPSWSMILTLFEILVIPFSIYSLFRLPGVIIYAIMEVYLQVFLINQHILKIVDDDISFKKMTPDERILYNHRLFKKLCFCIQHHSALGR
jgi:hypothetical protein